MCRLILIIAAVVAIAQLSSQASLPNDEHLKYSFHNSGPDDTQKLDIVVISDSNQSNFDNRNMPVSVFNSPSLSFTNWPNFAVGLMNFTITNYINSTICFLNPTFCCSFEIFWQNVTTNVNNQDYVYRFGIFRGYNNVTNTPTVCSVFRCATENIRDCDRNIISNTNVVFDNITITANITKDQEYLLEPYSFTANTLPLNGENYEWHEFKENDFYGARYVLNTTVDNLYAFSLNGTGNGTVGGGGIGGGGIGGGGIGGGGVGGGGGGGGAGALAVSMFIMFSVFLFTFMA